MNRVSISDISKLYLKRMPVNRKSWRHMVILSLGILFSMSVLVWLTRTTQESNE